jgi:hypothetical protein
MADYTFEPDLAALFPDNAHPETPAGMIADLKNRVATLEENQLRLLTLIEQMVAGDKVRAQAFDLLHERVGRAESIAAVRQQGVDLLRERMEILEQEVRQS